MVNIIWKIVKVGTSCREGENGLYDSEKKYYGSFVSLRYLTAFAEYGLQKDSRIDSLANDTVNTLKWYKGEFAGVIGFHGINWSSKSVSIGYWLDERYMGKGIMTKACRAFIDHAFKEYKLNRVEIRCAEENYKSRAIPERLGFTKEGIVREAEWLYNYYVNHIIYGMLASEWK